MPKEIMDLKEVAKYLSFSQKKLYNLVKERKIPFARIGGQYRFVKDDIDAWLKGQARDTYGKYEVSQYMVRSEDPVRYGNQINLTGLRSMPDTYEKRLLFVGLLTKELTKYNIRPIIVGGNAVEFYTLGGYATADIDVVIEDHKILGKVLTGWGFKKQGRHWTSEEYDIIIESPGDELSGSVDKIFEVEIKGLKVYLEGIEDIVIDRLNALVHWKSKDDGEWARRMVELNRDKIDWKYLEKRAKKEKVEKALERLKNEKI
jgi:excisionase family DNA binding protein